MGLIATLGLKPTARMQRAMPGMRAAQAPLGLAPAAFSAPAGASVKGGADIEVVNREFTPFKTKYGDLKVSATLKFQATAEAGGNGAGFTGVVTSKDKADGRTTGTKKTFAYNDIADRELLAGFALKDFSVGLESEISGLDVSVSGLVKFTLVTSVFEAKAQAKLTLLNIKGAKEIAGPGLEIKVAPAEFSRKLGGIETKVFVEYKASFTVDAKKVGAEVGKKVLEKAAKEALEKEAKRQGVKRLGRKAAETLLKDLGPLAAAFGVGLDIGGLLNQYTIAPQAAKFVIDEIIGDLPERFHEKDTLGKMWLITKNSPRILAALVAGGLIGTAAGVADIVLFKIFGLDKLADYAEALKAFSQGLTEMAQVAQVPVQTMATAITGRAVVLGIKFNPRHTRAHWGSLEPIIAAIHARIAPLFKDRKSGPSNVIAVRVGDASLDAAGLLNFAGYVQRKGFKAGATLDLSSPERVAASLRALPLSDFLRFLEANHLIACDVKLDDNLDPDDIDEKLLDELYG